KKVSNVFMHNFRAIAKRLPGFLFHNWWLEEWSRKLPDYTNIVVFDNAISLKLLEYIDAHKTRSSKLKLWLWNVPNKQVNYLNSNYDVYCFDKTYSENYNLKFV
ncbi:TPA: glycosyltransferase, partial [Streptococcus pneumoniae]